MSQIKKKKKDKITEKKRLHETEISNMTDEEFKVMVITIVKTLEGTEE